MANKKYGTITMRNEMLIQFANELNYKKIIPMHYEDYSHYQSNIEEFLLDGLNVLERGKWIDLNDMRE